MSLRGHIVWTQGVSAHDVSKTAKPRPLLVLGDGHAYGIARDTIVGLSCTTLRHKDLAPTNTTLLCGLSRELAERLDLKQMFVNMGGFVILPYPSSYVETISEDPAQTVVIRERLVAHYKKAADAVFGMPPHETFQAPVFGEIRRPVPAGSIVNFNASLKSALRHDPKAWIRRVIVLGKGQDFGLNLQSLVCCPYERNKKNHLVTPLVSQAFEAPLTSLHFPDAATPVSKVTEKALSQAVAAASNIDTSLRAQYACEIKRARARPNGRPVGYQAHGNRAASKGMHV